MLKFYSLQNSFALLQEESCDEPVMDEEITGKQQLPEKEETPTESRPKEKPGNFREMFMSRILERMQACKPEDNRK